MHLNRWFRPGPSLLTITLGTTLLALPGATATPIAAGASVAPAITQDDDSPQRRESFAWQGDATAGQTVEIRNINGAIHAAPSTSGRVEVSATKTGRRSNPSSVRIVTVPHANGVTICALYPDVDGEANECVPGGGHHNSRDNDVKVEFWVKVPPGTLFTGRSVNGGIDAQNLDASASLDTVNGSITLKTMSYANAKTVNGSITASLGQANWTEPLELKTVNGSIELFLPAGTDADLHAKTVNGRIDSDLPLMLREMSRRAIRGTLGAGGRELNLQTVNGSIALRTGGAN